jgi:hypothetical protein
MTKDQPLKEMEKVIGALSEALNKLKNDEITPEEANAITQECEKNMARIKTEMKETKKR